jgi:aminoglycoside phosphotransferase (APT) family kinase protein
VPADDPPFTVEGWVLELSDEQQATMNRNALAQLAAIHATDYRQIGLGFLDEPEHHPGLDGQLEFYRQLFYWSADACDHPGIQNAFEWLEGSRPESVGHHVLNWGDARVGNMLFGHDLAVTGVLDWEMVVAGPRELDLGWWQFAMRLHTEAIGAPPPSGFPSPEDALAQYEQLSGHRVRDIHYFEVFAALRLAIYMIRVATVMVNAGLLPEDSTMAQNNPAAQLLATLTGQAAPLGEATHWVGNR